MQTTRITTDHEISNLAKGDLLARPSEPTIHYAVIAVGPGYAVAEHASGKREIFRREATLRVG